MPSKTSTVRISTAAPCVSTKHSPVKSVAAVVVAVVVAVVAAVVAAVDTVAAAAVIAVAAAAAAVIAVAAAAAEIAVAAAAVVAAAVAAVAAGNHPQPTSTGGAPHRAPLFCAWPDRPACPGVASGEDGVACLPA